MPKFGKKNVGAVRGNRKLVEVELPELRDEDGTNFTVFFMEPSVADLIEIAPHLDDLSAEMRSGGEQSGRDVSIQANVLADIATRLIVDVESNNETFLDRETAKALIFRNGAEPLREALVEKMAELQAVRTGDDTAPSFPAASEESGASDSGSASPSDSPTPTK